MSAASSTYTTKHLTVLEGLEPVRKRPAMYIGGADSKPAILQVNPDIIAIGSDWLERDYFAQMGFTPDWLVGQGITLMYLAYTDGVSSTQIRAAIGQ